MEFKLGVIIATLVLSAFAAYFMCKPLFGETVDEDQSSENLAKAGLESELVERLTELEADLRSGKIDPEVYSTLKEDYLGELAQVVGAKES